jgi:hypothetical protein
MTEGQQPWHDDPELSGTWVRKAGEPRRHECSMPAGAQIEDLWRCGCGRLWRWTSACDTCASGGHGDPPRGQHAVGWTWRPATLGQRIRYWRRS